MFKYTLGFIGVGSMGGALATAALRQNPKDVIIANRTPGKAEALAGKYGCAVGTFEEVAASSRYVVIGVLPDAVAEVAGRIYPVMKGTLVSMASGITLEMLHEYTAPDFPVMRIMPNTPVAVGKGLVFYATDGTAADADGFIKAMACAGAVEPLEERLFTAGGTVAGCGPAFTAIFIDALADGGVKAGLPRKKAIMFAEQMVLGTAALALETGKHPDQLRDEVCSPGGSTIEGVQALEEGGFRAAAMRAVVTAWEKHR